MSKTQQQQLANYTAGTTTETITRTLVAKLETSDRKNERVREKMDEWQEIAGRIADLMPSFPKYRWGNTQDTHLYRVMTREFPDHNLMAATAQQAMNKVTEAYGSWHSNGCRGDRPRFGNGDYMRLRADDTELVENDRGYGLKTKLEPYTDAEWFHITANSYHYGIFESVTDGDATTGSVELHLRDGGLYAHITVSRPVEVYQADDVNTHAGVDIGENAIYAAAVVNGDGGVTEVDMENGREFRHHREELKRKREQLSSAGDLSGVKQCRGDIERYTEHTLNTASKRIVDLADAHSPCVIRLEDLAGYRETADDAIHDWPYASLQEKISYKATEAGIPVETVDAAYTSVTCRKCGQQNRESRDGVEFACRRCGYEVHADVNAAINIALA